MERIGRALGVYRGTLYRWARLGGWRRPAPPERLTPSGTRRPDFYRSRRLGRPYGGDAVGTARDLVTGSTLPLRRVAERAGIGRATLYRWIARRGWVRNPAAAKGRRRRGRYPPEVVAAARELVQTTGLSLAFIAARVGATPERVGYWMRTKGWGRPWDLPEAYGRVRRGRRRLAHTSPLAGEVERREASAG
ncbi:hypothetical protein [Enterovirga rhinocerotis]|uniref:Uncharacterized protein n=1 Tax=Enterovirga rhinocerotis TaxID=1339210 RepID=A0A4R7C612_9HYPH|nr:hypothetical protein [Enterovirga rhinocerotis]TDR93533.1 hypothetical protein EV668_0797 [Enterovirga rhinocerotis]